MRDIEEGTFLPRKESFLTARESPENGSETYLDALESQNSRSIKSEILVLENAPVNGKAVKSPERHGDENVTESQSQENIILERQGNIVPSNNGVVIENSDSTVQYEAVEKSGEAEKNFENKEASENPETSAKASQNFRPVGSISLPDQIPASTQNALHNLMDLAHDGQIEQYSKGNLKEENKDVRKTKVKPEKSSETKGLKSWWDKVKPTKQAEMHEIALKESQKGKENVEKGQESLKKDILSNEKVQKFLDDTQGVEKLIITEYQPPIPSNFPHSSMVTETQEDGTTLQEVGPSFIYPRSNSPLPEEEDDFRARREEYFQQKSAPRTEDFQVVPILLDEPTKSEIKNEGEMSKHAFNHGHIKSSLVLAIKTSEKSSHQHSSQILSESEFQQLPIGEPIKNKEIPEITQNTSQLQHVSKDGEEKLDSQPQKADSSREASSGGDKSGRKGIKEWWKRRQTSKKVANSGIQKNLDGAKEGRGSLRVNTEDKTLKEAKKIDSPSVTIEEVQSDQNEDLNQKETSKAKQQISHLPTSLGLTDPPEYVINRKELKERREQFTPKELLQETKPKIISVLPVQNTLVTQTNEFEENEKGKFHTKEISLQDNLPNNVEVQFEADERDHFETQGTQKQIMYKKKYENAEILEYDEKFFQEIAGSTQLVKFTQTSETSQVQTSSLKHLPQRILVDFEDSDNSALVKDFSTQSVETSREKSTLLEKIRQMDSQEPPIANIPSEEKGLSKEPVKIVQTQIPLPQQIEYEGIVLNQKAEDQKPLKFLDEGVIEYEEIPLILDSEIPDIEEVGNEPKVENFEKDNKETEPQNKESEGMENNGKVKEIIIAYETSSKSSSSKSSDKKRKRSASASSSSSKSSSSGLSKSSSTHDDVSPQEESGMTCFPQNPLSYNLLICAIHAIKPDKLCRSV